jgi:uncharacterized protein YbdZ (MbtH family)
MEIDMNFDEQPEDRIFVVVKNDEEQYSLWPKV